MSELSDRGPGSPGKGGSAADPGGGEAWLFGIRLLGGRYAFEAPLVTEVVRLGPLTRLPGAPAFLPGVFTHRGEVLAVLDLCQALSLPPASVGVSARAAVIRVGEWKLALLADAIEGLVAVPGRSLEAPPSGASPAAAWLSAVYRD